MENREQTPMRPSRRVGTFTFGVTLVIFGLWMLASLLLPEAVTFWVLLAGALAAALVPTVMSYLWYRKRSNSKP